MQPRLMRGVFSNVNDINLFLMIFPRMSLHPKLVPVQYREYENGLLFSIFLNKEINKNSLTLCMAIHATPNLLMSQSQ